MTKWAVKNFAFGGRQAIVVSGRQWPERQGTRGQFGMATLAKIGLSKRGF